MNFFYAYPLGHRDEVNENKSKKVELVKFWSLSRNKRISELYILWTQPNHNRPAATVFQKSWSSHRFSKKFPSLHDFKLPTKTWKSWFFQTFVALKNLLANTDTETNTCYLMYGIFAENYAELRQDD